MPPIELVIKGQEMDIMVAQIPVTQIPTELKLTDHKNREIVQENIFIINELINRMAELNDLQYVQSILILTGLFLNI